MVLLIIQKTTFLNVLNLLHSRYLIQLFLTPNFMPLRNTIQPCLAAITMARVCFRIYEKASIDSGSRFVYYFYVTFIDCK